MPHEIMTGVELPIRTKTDRIEYRRKWKADNPEKLKRSGRKAQLKRKYGMTLEDYDERLLSQGGHCALCNKTPDGERYGVLAVDHCHRTNRVRGLLCDIHNRALGAFGDDEEGLLKAIAYING